MNRPSLRWWTRAAWAGAALLLLMPLAAMQITDEVDWTAGDFVVAGVLLFGTAGLFQLATRRAAGLPYVLGVALALVTSLGLVWVILAVGILDVADEMYGAVLLVGAFGTALARLRPKGMVRAMLATAFATIAVGGFALAIGVVPAYNTPLEILGINAMFAGLYAGSAFLFHTASRQRGA